MGNITRGKIIFYKNTRRKKYPKVKIPVERIPEEKIHKEI